MSQKPRAAMKPADADPRPVAEPADAIAEGVSTVADANADVMAVPAEAGSETVTAAAETVTAVSTDVTPMPVAEPADTIAESVTAAAEAAVEVMAVTAEAVGKATTAAAETVTTISVESAPASAAIETTKPATKPGMEKKNTNNVAAFVAFSQGNLEALVKSGQNWGAGIQDLTQQIAATATASFDESVSTFQAFSRVKSLSDAIDLQTRFTKTAIETAMAGTKQIADASIKWTKQTLSPLTDRVSLAVQTFNKAA